MKRVSLRYLAPITIATLVPLVTLAAPPFSGPSTQPTGGNVPGVIWNVEGTSVTQPTAQINIGGQAKVGNVYSNTNDNTLYKNIFVEDTKAIHVDKVGSSTFNMGNWGNGQQPFTFNIYGDLKMNKFLPGGTGANGSIDAQQYCIAGANCITAWPVGGGGTLTGITAGTGITVSGSAPSPTINATDLYVNTTGDTMTGKLTLNWPGYHALEVNGGNGGGGAIYGNNSTAYGYGGEFYGSYGVYASTPNSSSGYYAGYFDGYAGGVNGIGRVAGGVGVVGSNAGAGSYGVRGYAANGYGGFFNDSSYYSYVGGQGYGMLTNGLIYTSNSVSVQNTASNQVASRFVASGSYTSAMSDPPGVTAVYANGTTYGVYAKGGYMAGRFINGTQDVAIGESAVGVDATSFNTGGGFTGMFRNYNGATQVSGVNLASSNYSLIASGKPVSIEADMKVEPSIGSTSYVSMNTSGQVQTEGASNGYYFNDRSSSLNWALYSTSDEARLWNNTYGDVYHFHNNGVFFAANDITTNNNIYTTNGNLGARVSSPAYPLDVAGTANFNKGIGTGPAILVNGAEALWYNGTYFSWGYGGTANYFADNVGIGVTAPAYQLQLSANSAAKPTSNVWTVASDKRLKDIHGSYDKGLDEITKLDPITYTYKKGNIYNYPSDTMSIGAVAQDVQKVFPEAVSTDKNGYLQLDTNAINWASINAFKELKAQNEALKAKNDDLEQRLERLEAKVGKLVK